MLSPQKLHKDLKAMAYRSNRLRIFFRLGFLEKTAQYCPGFSAKPGNLNDGREKQQDNSP